MSCYWYPHSSPAEIWCLVIDTHIVSLQRFDVLLLNPHIFPAEIWCLVIASTHFPCRYLMSCSWYPHISPAEIWCMCVGWAAHQHCLLSRRTRVSSRLALLWVTAWPSVSPHHQVSVMSVSWCDLMCVTLTNVSREVDWRIVQFIKTHCRLDK